MPAARHCRALLAETRRADPDAQVSGVDGRGM